LAHGAGIIVDVFWPWFIGVRFQLIGGLPAALGNWGQIPIVLKLKSRFSRPPWGRIFLVFRSKNGPQAVRLKLFFGVLKKPCFEGVVSRDVVFSRIYDT
jgi:hypothetical protein